MTVFWRRVEKRTGNVPLRLHDGNLHAGKDRRGTKRKHVDGWEILEVEKRFLRCAVHGETVDSFGRNDGFLGGWG
jgi:hypothetical protein